MGGLSDVLEYQNCGFCDNQCSLRIALTIRVWENASEIGELSNIGEPQIGFHVVSLMKMEFPNQVSLPLLFLFNDPLHKLWESLNDLSNSLGRHPLPPVHRSEHISGITEREFGERGFHMHPWRKERELGCEMEHEGIGLKVALCRD